MQLTPSSHKFAYLVLLNQTCITLFDGVNSLDSEKCESNYPGVFFKLILRVDNLNTSCEIGLRWVLQKPIDCYTDPAWLSLTNEQKFVD